MDRNIDWTINEINARLRHFMAVSQGNSDTADLAEREIMILEILNHQGQMTVTKIAETFPYTSESAISTAITRLWRDKELVLKQKDYQNQRTRTIKLTDKGKKVIEDIGMLPKY